MQTFVRQVEPETRELRFADGSHMRDIVRMLERVKLACVESRILTGTEDLAAAAIAVEAWGCPEVLI
jgi:hypothetical protein